MQDQLSIYHLVLLKLEQITFPPMVSPKLLAQRHHSRLSQYVVHELVLGQDNLVIANALFEHIHYESANDIFFG